MVQYSYNHKILVHIFLNNDQLWVKYAQLELLKIQTWDNLAVAFVSQQKFNIDVAPNRYELQYISKNVGESFKEYVQF